MTAFLRTVAVLSVLAPAAGTAGAQTLFRIEESTIADVQNAIKSGQTTCRAVVQAYLDRAKAYNGTCTALVTADGAPIPPAKGAVRAGAPLTFPTTTVPVSKVFPDFSEYAGLPFEFGRMEPTISDPSVQQQFGMRVGIPNAGQLNALETLNIRGERSVTCKGDSIALRRPARCHPARRPSAKSSGSSPTRSSAPRSWTSNTAATPIWRSCRCTAPCSRSRTGTTRRTCAPPAATTSTSRWTRRRSTRRTSLRSGPRAQSSTPWHRQQHRRSVRARPRQGAVSAARRQPRLWGLGRPDLQSLRHRARAARHQQWSGISVAANLVACSICEQSSASCKGPASRNNVVNLLTTKGILLDGGMTGKHAGDRAGIHCRTTQDAVTVLDAIKGYESGDFFTAIPKALIPKEPYASFLVGDKATKNKPLKGMRVGVVREFMVKHTKNDVAISDQIDKEIKTVLRDKLGAELVESVDPLYPDDPAIPNMKYTFQDAIAEILPSAVPEYFWQKTRSGELEFAVPGWDVTTVDYAVALATGKAPLSPKLNLRRIARGLANPSSPFDINKYLVERGDARVKDWASWVANAKFESEADRIGAQLAIADQDPRATRAASAT